MKIKIKKPNSEVKNEVVIIPQKEVREVKATEEKNLSVKKSSASPSDNLKKPLYKQNKIYYQDQMAELLEEVGIFEFFNNDKTTIPTSYKKWTDFIKDLEKRIMRKKHWPQETAQKNVAMLMMNKDFKIKLQKKINGYNKYTDYISFSEPTDIQDVYDVTKSFFIYYFLIKNHKLKKNGAIGIILKSKLEDYKIKIYINKELKFSCSLQPDFCESWDFAANIYDKYKNELIDEYYRVKELVEEREKLEAENIGIKEKE